MKPLRNLAVVLFCAALLSGCIAPSKYATTSVPPSARMGLALRESMLTPSCSRSIQAEDRRFPNDAELTAIVRAAHEVFLSGAQKRFNRPIVILSGDELAHRGANDTVFQAIYTTARERGLQYVLVLSYNLEFSEQKLLKNILAPEEGFFGLGAILVRLGTRPGEEETLWLKHLYGLSGVERENVLSNGRRIAGRSADELRALFEADAQEAALDLLDTLQD